ncbi:sensor c-di-GMP phosphodiesterase, contains CSS-motif sensor and EAL domain [Paraburkholderia lycopersici]|uniref:cyclic-guanylate-specific phosphodiesterase n=2 Tax=Paraburkholderia lycopersici TaxID=416944 RepID=A0A1G6MNL4_9BURK|nr:sensor c-di-GMP phosphodiesterase, contains CSS-motif sensor and EAL domain [Paraburkholderia lycopersici]
MPVALCGALTRYEARLIQQREAALSTALVKTQINALLLDVDGRLARLAPIAGRRCPELLPRLMREAAVVPHLRSLNVVDGDVVRCSSAAGMDQTPPGAIANIPAHAPSGPWLAIASGTPVVPDRPALFVGRPTGTGRTVFAVIDDRYLMDLIQDVAPPDMFDGAEIQLGTGVISRRAEPDGTASMLVMTAQTTMQGHPVAIRLYGSSARLYRNWGALALRFAPIALVLSAVLVWLCYRVQQSLSSMHERILRGIRAREFHVEYQPLYSIETGGCASVEALLRWRRRDLGPVRPDVFISSAEDEHVIVPLTQHMLALVGEDMQAWAAPPGFHVSVNFASGHLSSPVLLDDVRAFAASIAARRPQIIAEITERNLIGNASAARRMIPAQETHTGGHDAAGHDGG